MSKECIHFFGSLCISVYINNYKNCDYIPRISPCYETQRHTRLNAQASFLAISVQNNDMKYMYRVAPKIVYTLYFDIDE